MAVATFGHYIVTEGSSTTVKRVLVTGATGFIGGRLCEVLHASKHAQPRALVHSTASAARITRYPLDVVVGDLTDSVQADKAVEGCDAVVHLARGNDRVMSKGLENVLAASKRHRVSRFVHMSSVAIYGNNPPPESRYEEAPGCPGQMLYGRQKLSQEKRVLAYYRRYGLPVVILRPPNVYGPHSAFTTGLIQKIKAGKLALVDGGHNPCNLVYIDNLIEAILLALWKPEAVGQAFFVTDKNAVTWARVLGDHANLLGASVTSISSVDLWSAPPKRLIRDTLISFPRVVFSGEFRSVLRQVPLLGWIEGLLYDRFEALPTAVKDHLRQAINGPQRFSKRSASGARFDQSDNILAAQGRRVAHSSEKAMRLLGYSAAVDYEQGMTLTAAWLRYAQWI